MRTAARQSRRVGQAYDKYMHQFYVNLGFHAISIFARNQLGLAFPDIGKQGAILIASQGYQIAQQGSRDLR